MLFKFLNLILRISIIFLICLIWARYFVSNLTMVLVYTALATVIIELAIHFFLQRKTKKLNLKKDEEKLVEKITANFIYDPSLAINYFFELGKINYNPEKHKNFVILNSKTDAKQKTIIFPCFSFSVFDEQQLVNALRQTQRFDATKLVVCCKSYSKQASEIAKKFTTEIVLLDAKDCFLKVMKPHNYFPQNLKEIEFKQRPTFKQIVMLAFSKKKIKGYLLGSFVLLLSSFFVKMNIYYVVVSSLLLVCCLVCLLVPENKTAQQKNII